jgi:hypothetical protein
MCKKFGYNDKNDKIIGIQQFQRCLTKLRLFYRKINRKLSFSVIEENYFEIVRYGNINLDTTACHIFHEKKHPVKTVWIRELNGDLLSLTYKDVSYLRDSLYYQLYKHEKTNKKTDYILTPIEDIKDEEYSPQYMIMRVPSQIYARYDVHPLLIENDVTEDSIKVNFSYTCKKRTHLIEVAINLLDPKYVKIEYTENRAPNYDTIIFEGDVDILNNLSDDLNDDSNDHSNDDLNDVDNIQGIQDIRKIRHVQDIREIRQELYRQILDNHHLYQFLFTQNDDIDENDEDDECNRDDLEFDEIDRKMMKEEK